MSAGPGQVLFEFVRHWSRRTAPDIAEQGRLVLVVESVYAVSGRRAATINAVAHEIGIDQSGASRMVKEAAAVFPRGLDALEGWTAPWDRTKAGPSVATAEAPRAARGPIEREASRLLAAFPATTDALATALGLPARWSADGSPPAPSVASPGPEHESARALLRDHPATTVAAASALE